MDILTFSQIIFNFTATAVIVVVGIMVGVIAYEAIMAIRRAKKFFNNLNEKSTEALRYIDNMVAGMAFMPFISKLFKAKKSKKGELN